jgi:hypothetical protein
MKNTQLSSPETDRKIAWSASVIFMVVAWLSLAGFLTLAFVAGPHSWGILECSLVGVSFLAFLLIPFQLVRYFREKWMS